MKREAFQRVLAIAVLVWALLPVAAPADGPRFSPAEKKLLAKGKVVQQELPTSRKNGFYGGSGWVVIDAQADDVFAALLDWNAYLRIFPHTVEVKELSRKGDRSLIRMRLGHPVISVTYHLEMHKDPAKRMLSFKQVSTHPSDLDDIRGYWRLFPQKDGRTLAVYVVALNVPMGIVNMVGPVFEAETVEGILGLPQYIKRWSEGPGRSLHGPKPAP